MYEGESGRSARVRGQEHLRDLEKERPKSVLFKHVKNAHQNEEVKFQMEITQKFRDALIIFTSLISQSKYVSFKIQAKKKNLSVTNS